MVSPPAREPTALPSLAALAATFRALLRRTRAPRRFVFQVLHEQSHTAPILLLAPPGQRLCPARLRALGAVPGYRAGRQIEGWTLWNGRRCILATTQRVPDRVLRCGLARLAALCSVPLPLQRLDIYTGPDGARLLCSLDAIRWLSRHRGPTAIQVTPGALPMLALVRAGPPLAACAIPATAVRAGRMLRVVVDGSASAAEQVGVVLEQLARLSGNPALCDRLSIHRQEEGRTYRMPSPAAAQALQYALDGTSSSRQISPAEHQLVCDHGASPTYGELEPAGLAQIFARVEPRRRSFLDLGAGGGRAVLAAGVGYPLARAAGVELAPSRAAAAQAALDRLRQRTGRPWTHLQFFEDDLLRFDVRGYDILFVSNLCFGADFTALLGTKLDRELDGTVHVFSSRPIPSQRASPQERLERVEMSWSQRSVLYHSIW